MTIEATAQALAPETALPVQVASPETTESEPDYGAVYDKITADAPIEAEIEPVEAIESPAEVEAPVETVEAPTDVPVALRKHWGTLTEEARDAVLSSQREMSRKLSDMGRQVQGIGPIRDVLVSAVKELPALGNMRPEEVASEVILLAKMSADFREKPVETFLALAQKHNMTNAVRQALGVAGQAPNNDALTNKLAALEQQLARAADPEFIRQQVSAVTMQERVTADVQAFAADKEHWGEVEDHLPKVIQIVREAMPNASEKDVLSRAYDIALQTYRPDLKAPAPPAVEAAPQPDPERTQAAIQAKSINVTGRTSGKPREMTEEEIYSSAYDRAVKK
ncbi:MAG: hypothetical protein ACRC14_02735 [Paracoccaceae bacterium]